MGDGETIHGTCVAIGAAGILIIGPSGSGKSDLALRLIDEGAAFIADDRTVLSRSGARIMARSPEALAGKIEIRGLGIVSRPYEVEAVLCGVIDLTGHQTVDRIPLPENRDISGVSLPVLRIDPFQPSAPARVRLFAAISSSDADILS